VDVTDQDGNDSGEAGGAEVGGTRKSRRRLSGRWLVAVTAAVVTLVVCEAFAAGWLWRSRHSAGGPLAGVTQVAGSSQADARYPGATLLPQTYVKPGVTLTDTSGRPYNLVSQTAGRVTLVYFGYTHCPDVCPINMALIAAALRLMPIEQRREVTVVFVTTDPARDTPSVMRAWLGHFDSSFVGLTGAVAQVHTAEQQVGMPLSFAVAVNVPGDGGYEISHAGYTLLYSQDDVAHLSVDDTETAANFAVTLERLVEHGFQT